MPVSWTITPKAPGVAPGAFALSGRDGAEYRLVLRPNLSMGPLGFARMILLSATFLALPMLAVLGTPVVWGLLPFAGLALWGLWYALSRNSAERRALHEELRLTRDILQVTRVNPRSAPQHWQTNPYWVSVTLREKGPPIENYLTLSGDGREIELGAFLSPEERAVVYDDLSRALRHLR